MRALQLIGNVGLENLQVVDLPEPKAGPGEVLVRMKAVSLNYRDLLMINGVYGRATPLPLTPFSDGCGVIEAVGGGRHALRGRRPGLHALLPELAVGKADDRGAVDLPRHAHPGRRPRTGGVPRDRRLQGSGLPRRPSGRHPGLRGPDRLAGDVRGRPAGARRHRAAAGHGRGFDLRPAVRQGGRLSDHHHLVVGREAGAGEGARRRPPHQLSRPRPTGRSRRGSSRRGAASTSSWRSAAAGP